MAEVGICLNSVLLLLFLELLVLLVVFIALFIPPLLIALSHIQELFMVLVIIYCALSPHRFEHKDFSSHLKPNPFLKGID